MDNKILITSAKVILIIAVVLCGIAILLPWNTFSYGLFGNMEFYTWGIHTSSTLSTSSQGWHIYYSDFSFFSTLFNSEESATLGTTMALLYCVLIFNLLTLIAGTSAINILNRKKAAFSLEAGIFSIIALVFFIIFIQFGLFSIPTVNAVSSLFNWSLGFYLTIIAIILFFIAYGIQKSIDFSPNKL